VPYAVLDQDRSSASHELLARLDGSGVFRRAANLDQAAAIKTMIDERDVLLVVQIGQDFECNLLSGKPANVQVVADGRNSNTAGIAIGYVNAVVDRFNADWLAAHGRAGPPTGSPPVRLQRSRGQHVANIRSQIKRNRQNEKRRLRNKAVRSELRTRTKRAVTEAEAGAETSAEALRLAIKRIDKAAAKGVIHKNQAANRKSRLMRRIARADAAS